jgi:hypothetical protein
MKNDPIVDAVRQTRDTLARECGYNVHAIFADLRRREMGIDDRLVRPSNAMVGLDAEASKFTNGLQK